MVRGNGPLDLRVGSMLAAICIAVTIQFAFRALMSGVGGDTWACSTWGNRGQIAILLASVAVDCKHPHISGIVRFGIERYLGSPLTIETTVARRRSRWIGGCTPLRMHTLGMATFVFIVEVGGYHVGRHELGRARAMEDRTVRVQGVGR